MKIANLEGTTEEIKNFFQDNGLKATDFFEQPESPINTFWLVAPGVCVFLCLAAQSLLALPSTPQKFLYIVNCFFAICWALALQLRFKNAWATSIVAIGCLLLALVALGAVTPIQVLEELKAIKK